jgi:hypothetical protein
MTRIRSNFLFAFRFMNLPKDPILSSKTKCHPFLTGACAVSPLGMKGVMLSSLYVNHAG